jgi:hypothetical protein
MVDRHWPGDVSLAILLALPFVAFAQPHATSHKPASTASPVQLSVASAAPSNGRISLLG